MTTNTDIQPTTKLPKKKKSLQELLVERANKDQLAIATAILELVKEGDASAIKTLQGALERASYTVEEEQFPLSDKRFNEIIEVAYKRLKGELAT